MHILTLIFKIPLFIFLFLLQLLWLPLFFFISMFRLLLLPLIRTKKSRFDRANEAVKSGDLKTAFSIMKASAEQGDAEAQYNLGVMYAFGEGVSQNYDEAVKWYSKSAEQGFAEAQMSLATMHYEGTGVSQNYVEAFKWYSKSAEQGDAVAQFLLAYMYYRGKGISLNYEEALKWQTKSAKQGFALAQKNLAGMYYEGKGVPKNYIKAYIWFYIAMANGNEDAKELLQLLEKEMDSAQIAEAKDMAKRCLESNYENCDE